jgi:hypothetical protein
MDDIRCRELLEARGVGVSCRLCTLAGVGNALEVCEIAGA